MSPASWVIISKWRSEDWQQRDGELSPDRVLLSSNITTINQARRLNSQDHISCIFYPSWKIYSQTKVMLGDPNCDFQHKDGPKITQVNEWPFSALLRVLLSPRSFSCSCKTYTVCCCPWLRPSSPGPVMDQTGSRLRWDRNRNIMNYGPCTAAASWPLSGFTWNSCSEHNLSGRASSCPACWRGMRSRNPTLARTFKKVSFNI